ncbi:MAG: hypothetical protein IT287_09095 [Bdellovibrionaceae bacterium]|nr:hypothetical protein [Pseudobdellovibrionaceae bacterium]
MIRSLLFFIVVYSFDVASASNSCSSLFELSSSTSETTPLSLQKSHPKLRTQPQTTDVVEHGLVIQKSDAVNLEAAQRLLAERDGTYPLIIDKNLNVVIDHRLPDTATPMDQPYVGNHRGLYQKLKTFLGTPPDVVFAGQLRVIGGRVVNITDQSGTFYFLPSDFGFKGKSEMPRLIEKNQERLDQAVAYLISLNLIPASVEVINFMQRFQHYAREDRNEGHVKAKDAAKFERYCRANPACWAKYKIIDQQLRKLVLLGSKSEIYEYLKVTLPGTMAEKFENFQFWNLILNEGIIDVLAAPTMMEPTSMSGRLLDKFLISVEQMP